MARLRHTAALREAMLTHTPLFFCFEPSLKLIGSESIWLQKHKPSAHRPPIEALHP